MKTWDEIIAGIAKAARENEERMMKATETLAVASNQEFTEQEREDLRKQAENRAIEKIESFLHRIAFAQW